MSDLNDFMSEPDGNEPESSTTETTETPESTDVKKESAKALKPYMAQLPDKYKTDERLAQFDGFGGLADAYFETLSKLPAVPEKPEDYEIADLSKGVKFLDGFDKAFATWAKEAGLSKSQAQAFHEQWIKGLSMAQEERTRAMGETDKTLRQEWGSDYDKNVEAALRASEQFGGGDFAKLLSDTGLRENPVVVKTFAAIGRALAEDTAIRGGTGDKETEEARILDEAYPSMRDL